MTRDSVKFHVHFGYRLVGEFHKCGYKFGRWYDMVWMEKHLQVHPKNPLPVKRFDEIRGDFEWGLGASALAPKRFGISDTGMFRLGRRQINDRKKCVRSSLRPAG